MPNPWYTLQTTEQRLPYDFGTLIETGKWCTSFGHLRRNIQTADAMPIKDLETQNLVKMLLTEAYELRNEWGDTHFPPDIMRWVRRWERYFNMEPSKPLNNGYLARAGIESWKKQLYNLAQVDKGESK